MKDLYCSKCGRLVITKSEYDDGEVVFAVPNGEEIDPDGFLCRECAKKLYGEAYMDYIENNAEILEDEENND